MIAEVVVFLDVDNTLLDNDRIIADLRLHLEEEFGVASSDRYWRIFEKLRDELGYADYLGALQRYRAETDQGGGAGDPRLLRMSTFLVDYPFADRLYPDALEVVARLGKLGPTVILSDGDVVFQPRKVQRSGLWEAVGGRVLIYIHKEKMLEQVQRLYPLPGPLLRHPQRLLWASTGTKDPAARDTLYVESLAAPDTVDTIPDKTLKAFADHGKVQAVLPLDGGDAETVIAEYRKLGIDDAALAQRLQEEGADSFQKSWGSLLAGIKGKSAQLAGVTAK